MARLDRKTVEGLISPVQKPGRYMGLELNSIVKETASLRMALSYPDLYEIGMSNNGLRILYNILNALPEVACERVFAVEADFERVLRRSRVPLYTLETYTPLHELDILGFNLSHELLCTNVLQILDLGGIPLHRAERKGSEPVIIAGGEGASNPFPMSDFIDAFFIGDGEEGIVEIAEALLSAKGKNLGRSDIVDRIANIEGDLKGPMVRKRIYRGRDLVDPVKPIVPNIRIVQGRVAVEVTRGCDNLCSFCHAGFYDLPYRWYDYRAIEDRILEIVRNTGYNEVTLSSLSVSDYPHLSSLINAILPRLTERGISVSFPSLKVDTATLPLIEQISEVRRASLTFAVESASEPIRVRANKKVLIQDLLDIVRHVHRRGWKVIKLYFMIGLPGCGEHDEAADIISLLSNIYRIGGRGLDINVTVSPFVPKPHTPFEQERQMSREYFESTILKIKRGVPRAVRIKNHDVNGSILEGVLARGEERLGAAILGSYLQGCRFDSWEEHFRFDIWRENLDRVLPGWERCLGPRDQERLPWRVIATGFESLMRKQRDRTGGAPAMREGGHLKSGDVDLPGIEEAKKRFTRRFSVKRRIRLRFAKTGMIRFIPHIDFMEIVKRSLRMADVPVAMTQGFNKRERISAGFPLPLGIESEAELVDVDLFDEIQDDLRVRLSFGLPAGIYMADARYIDRGDSVMAVTGVIEYRITMERGEMPHAFAQNLEAAVDFFKREKNSEHKIPFKAVVHSYDFPDANKSLLLRLYAGTGDSVRIHDAVGVLSGGGALEREGMRIVKTAQYRNVNGVLELIL